MDVFAFLVFLIFLVKFTNGEDDFEIVLKSNRINSSVIEILDKDYNMKFVKRLFDDFYVFKSGERFIPTRKRRNIDNDFLNHFEYHIQKRLIRVKRDVSHELEYFSETFKKFDDFILRKNEQVVKKCEQSKYNFNDPSWQYQWYMNDGCIEGTYLNITGAWDQGMTGRGIIVSIIDDGVERTNTDLIQNYDLNASIDLNERDNDPQPRYDFKNENKHGTRCAGEISASANDSFCGVGVAYNSRIGGIRLLDGKINDRLEAEALIFNINYIDIYSASWGPSDNGKTLDGPGVLAKAAFLKGITEGRKGKGTIYVWASGNGGHFDDNCNCDGYTNSIYTITISSVTKDHNVPTYSEKCSSILATTYSSDDASGNSHIVTTDLHNKCTNSHSGTSAAAPIGAAIIALAFEANGNLTWRDIQYLIIKTSDGSKLNTNDWIVNGIGKRVSHSYGYGLMNAGRMVEMARTWKLVGEQLKCDIKIFDGNNLVIPGDYNDTFKVEIFKTSCKINTLEHVVSQITLKSGIRGLLYISLTSPYGTKSNLLENRKLDKSHLGFNNWPFMSVHYWGESPYGTWKLQIINSGSFPVYFDNWNLIFYGVD